MKNWLIKVLALVLVLSCLSAGAVAEELAQGITFTPSVEYKEVPEIKDGIGVTGDGRNAQVVIGGAYIVTPVSWVNTVNTAEIQDRLGRAYVNIRDRYSIGDLKAWEDDYTKRVFALEDEVQALLTSDPEKSIQELAATLEYEILTAPVDEAATIAAELDARLAALGLNLKAEDLVVRDLLDVHAFGIYYDYMQQPGSSVNIAFKLDIPMDETLLVLYSDDGEYWKLLPEDFVTNNEDGYVEVHIENLGVLAFAVPEA